MILPSKKLVQNVLELPLDAIPDNIKLICDSKYYNNLKQTLFISYNDGSEPIILNIYEFAFKCKEWTYKQQVSIKSGKTKFNGYFAECIFGLFNGDTEIESIFKASEQVLKEVEILNSN